MFYCDFSDSEDDLSLESDDKLEQYHGRRSKIAIFLTRSQFKQSYVRFSNAYDHFLINKFAVPISHFSKKKKNNVLSLFYFYRYRSNWIQRNPASMF